ncbi:MAG: hypothetical protein KJO91_00475 [Gammaproteobacteria bacterium]|nr:hypothetical protein [Gammaproteobacteria bacterium]
MSIVVLVLPSCFFSGLAVKYDIYMTGRLLAHFTVLVGIFPTIKLSLWQRFIPNAENLANIATFGLFNREKRIENNSLNSGMNRETSFSG